jgi:N-acetyl sugar amidotransferase
LDWAQRELLFENTLKIALKRRPKHAHYDCIVPLRGTPEYFYLLDLLVNKFQLRVLTVKFNSQFNSHVGIANIARLRETFDVDFIEQTSNPMVYKKLVKESIARLGSVRWPYLAGETQFPVQVAVEKKIPLIIWPYHQSTEQVGTHSYEELPEMSRMSRHSYDLMGIEPEDMIRPQSLINDLDIQDLNYPSDQKLKANGIRGLYLANFFPWDSRKYAELAVKQFGALAAKNFRTFDTYDRIDDVVYMTVHDLLKFSKFGYSRVTDSLCREIRFGRISRRDAKEVEMFYQSQFPHLEIKKFADWLGIHQAGIEWVLRLKASDTSFVDGHVSPLPDLQLSETSQEFVHKFATTTEDVHAQPGFILIGKGLKLNEVL